MSLENKKTIEVYQRTAGIYLSNDIIHSNLDPIRAEQKRKEIEELIKISFSSLPKSAEVFEIGSGSGENAKFIESLGFKVTASDTAKPFIEATRSQGVETIKFNALEDDFPDKYFAIFCWRVFVHFTRDDALKIIQKAYDALKENGIFLFSAINRETKDVDNEWVDFEGEYHMGEERYFNYFHKQELEDMIHQTPFQIENFCQEGGKNNNKWLIYVLKK